jgi:hypothetical protein
MIETSSTMQKYMCRCVFLLKMADKGEYCQCLNYTGRLHNLFQTTLILAWNAFALVSFSFFADYRRDDDDALTSIIVPCSMRGS